MRDLGKIMKQAQELQARMAKMQEEADALQVEGQAGGGLVRATLNGKSELVGMDIDPSLAHPDEIEILEDLVIAAVNDARRQVEQAVQEKMKEVTEGLPIPPGMKLPF
ncbi:MAG: YbaB/EbfC family nucleoid-associated protein [Hyphomicrobiales bacterium]|nr:YbaB/EbfC family nucleoid-associated protein [Hyphomicrobiales bacterium]